MLAFQFAPQLVYELSQNQKLLQELASVPLQTAIRWLVHVEFNRQQEQVFLRAANSLNGG